MSESGSNDAKICPWCERWSLKDSACAYVFACGLDFKNNVHLGKGCGRTWCWTCGKKYCSIYINPITGQKELNAKDNHNANCCKQEPDFKQEDYCEGGHSSHCSKRW